MELSCSVNGREGSLGSRPAGQATSADGRQELGWPQHVGGLQPGGVDDNQSLWRK